MSDFDEAVGKNMKQEPPDELIGVHGHDFAFVVVGIVAPPERDLVVFELHDPVIADRYAVGISAEVIENAFGSIERRLTVNDPLLLVQIGDQGIERRGPGKMAYGAGIDEFILSTKLFERGDELPPEELRHDLDRKKKALFA